MDGLMSKLSLRMTLALVASLCVLTALPVVSQAKPVRGASCVVDQLTINDGDFKVGRVTIANNNDVAITDWEVRFYFDQYILITNAAPLQLTDKVGYVVKLIGSDNNAVIPANGQLQLSLDGSYLRGQKITKASCRVIERNASLPVPTLRPSSLPSNQPPVSATPTVKPSNPATSNPPVGDQKISINGRKLLVNNVPFHIQGVDWNPVAKGGDYRNVDFVAFADQDIALMKEMGINVVRTYVPLTNIAVLNKLSNAGIYVVNSVYAYGGDTVESVQQLIAPIQNHPAILMWLVGSDWNTNGMYADFNPAQAQARVSEVAAFIKTLDPNHLIATVYDGVPNSATVNAMPNINVWGLSGNTGNTSFGNLFSNWAAISTKPMFVAGYGANALNVQSQTTAVVSLTRELYAQSAKYSSGVSLGGTVFEWADEWWKSGNPDQQDNAADEWWGLLSIDRVKRPVFNALKQLFLTQGSSAPTSTPPASTPTPPAGSASAIRINGRQLLVNNVPFHMQGVAWNPVARGGDYRNVDFAGFADQDIALMKEMGVNVVRTYGPISSIAVLDKLYAAGIYVVNTFNISDPGYVERVRTLVQSTKNHPAILMWSLGNEWNYNGLYIDLPLQQSQARINEVAALIKSLDTRHPVATIFGELPTAAEINAMPLIDIWGLNIYRGISFGNLFNDWAARSNKPMFLSEYGADAFNARINDVDLPSHATAVRSLTQELYNNSVKYEDGVALGGTVFEFADEWWKAGNPNQQDNGGNAPGGGPYPDATFNEEWWGLVSIDRVKRPAYDALKQLYTTHGDPLPPTPTPPRNTATPPRNTATPPRNTATPPRNTATPPRSTPIDEGGDIDALYPAGTQKEPDITRRINVNGVSALVTRISDRGRPRHAREDQFQSYDQYLPHYFENRVAGIEVVDYIATGTGNSVDFYFETPLPLASLEMRCFYRGIGTVAEYHENGGLNLLGAGESQRYATGELRPNQNYSYYKRNPLRTDPTKGNAPLKIGDVIECEPSQFYCSRTENPHDINSPRCTEFMPNGQKEKYYGTGLMYKVGTGFVPWDTAQDQYSDGPGPYQNENSFQIPESAWLGGFTTLHASKSNEPERHFMQMATNIGFDNGNHFLLGRRLHHSSFITGNHSEQGNPIYTEIQNKSGPHYIEASCESCHVRNGRAVPLPVGQALSKWVFKVADVNGNPDPDLGSVLQPKVAPGSGAVSEGEVSIASWVPSANTLRSPTYQFSKKTPARFSARIAPQLVGIGLLEAISEDSILELEDANDLKNGDGISGKANRVIDPVSGGTRLGRFGWKAGTVSVKHQVAGALNTDMGVMTSVLPNPDCGAAQRDCGSRQPELSDEDLEQLIKYNQLLGVRAQRNYNDPTVKAGKDIFNEVGCAGCHVDTFKTSANHPLAELRNQTIHPYTDLLLHDMGEGLADNLGEGNATGSEWRTTPLWGIGLSACVTGGIVGGQHVEYREAVCNPVESYLHDGRARSIEEAILWHGGEAEDSRERYEKLDGGLKSALLSFLRSL
jgi:hypothetical protein